MATIISSVQAKFDSLSFDGKPNTLYFGQAPMLNPNGTKLDFPLMQFYHEGTSGPATLEGDPIQFWAFRFEGYAASIAGIEALTWGVWYNNLPPTERNGFAYASTWSVPDEYEFQSMEPVANTFPLFTQIPNMRDANSSPAYQSTWRMILQVHRIA